ncbi:unnamed protein product [Ectocarpus sp. CCAP 1310/34]|nr:unnamed protein product [Ectocarpus sp. CCAP 1310/34]
MPSRRNDQEEVVDGEMKMTKLESCHL